MKQPEILTPASPRWPEFTRELCRLLDLHGCDTHPDKPCAQEALSKMSDVDMEGTLEWCESHGGHCDCEILLNCDHVNCEDNKWYTNLIAGFGRTANPANN